MGLFIHLTVNPSHITPEDWETAYQESLVLLQHFPAPLMRLHVEELGERHKRYVYTTKRVESSGTSEEHWEINGDMLSYQHAEPFRLYRHLATQFPHPCCEPDKDVLWADEKNIDYINGNGSEVFGNKTQGYPYHLAVFAVGMLLESRFPENIYVFGDIDRTQAEELLPWINRTLEQPVMLPICLDAQRLYHRLCRAYSDPRLAIRRFETLFRGTDEEKFEFLLQSGESPVVLQDFVEKLGYYSSLSQLGAIRLLSKFLTVTLDLRKLIEMVLETGQTVQKESEFNLEHLLNVLGRHFITIPHEERSPLSLFIRPEEHLMTIDDAFKQIFLTLGGAPDAIEFYMERETLIDLFASYSPSQRSAFEAMLEACEQHCRNALAQTQALIDELKQKEAQQAATEQRESQRNDTLLAPAAPYASVAPDEEYILKQVYTQQRRYPQAEEVAQLMGEQLQRIIREHPESFRAEEREECLKSLYQASFLNGFALRESAWEAIDREEKLTILNHLLALALIKEQAMSFWQWRIHFLEHPELWEYLSGAKTALPDYSLRY
jgi:hypothetical protein